MEAFLIILVLLMSVALLIWYAQTPTMKAFRLEEKKAKEVYRIELEKAKEVYRIENILDALHKDLDNINYCNSIPSLLHEGRKYHRYDYGQIYRLALDLLASNPDKIHIKTLCLGLGRIYYANLRPEKKPTIYDEQAIQNDIQVRSK